MAKTAAMQQLRQIKKKAKREMGKEAVAIQKAIVNRKVPTSVSQKQPKKKASGLFSALGGLGGGYLGGPAGAVLGMKAGDLISKITGFGAYKVNKNSIVEGQSIPSFRLNSEGVEIAHREFIADITGSAAFVISRLNINPGLPSSFPWLYRVAANFEEYDMKGLVFEFRPSSGTAVSNASAALGTVIFATDYNVLAPGFMNKQQMESYEFSSACVPFEPMMHPVECAPASNPTDTLWIRGGSAPTGSDLRLYDMGTFQYATQGMQTAYVIGELWVSYHVCFKKPRINPSGLGDYAHMLNANAGSGTAPFGPTGAQMSSDSTLPLITAGTDGNTLVVGQPGEYFMQLSTTTDGGAGPNSRWSVSYGSNLGPSGTIMNGSASNAIDAFGTGYAYDGSPGLAVNGSTGAVWSGSFICNQAGSGAANTITFGGLTGGTSLFSDCLLFPLPYTVN